MPKSDTTSIITRDKLAIIAGLAIGIATPVNKDFPESSAASNNVREIL